MSQHRSVWLATVDRPSYATLDDDIGVDVAVVGAGITGLTTALLLQRSGARVAVIDADRAGSGTTGHTTGKVTSQHGLTYHRLVERHGEHRARLYAEANQQTIGTVTALAEDSAADCQLERAPAYLYTQAADQRGALEAEHAAAVRLGLPATLTTEIDLSYPVELALRFDDQAHFHAARYTTALARRFASRGGRIFEHTRAVDVDERPDHAIVRTATGDLRADHVVLATLLPFVDLGGFFAKARPSRAYGVAARLRGSRSGGRSCGTASGATSGSPGSPTSTGPA